MDISRFRVCMNADLSPFDYHLYGLVRDYQMRVQGLVSTRLVAERLALPVRTVRHYMSRLEDAGLIFRPTGPKRGYSVMPIERSLALRKAYQWKAAAIDKTDILILQYIFANGRKKTGAISETLRLADRRVRYHMKKLEGLELVGRPAGKKSGYEASALAVKVVALADARYQLEKLSALRLKILQRMVELAQDDPMLLHSEHLAAWAELKPRTMRYHLNALEKRGLIIRPHARNGGYQLVKEAVKAVLDLAQEEGLLCHA